MSHKSSGEWPRFRSVALFLLFLAIASALQYASGSYRSEFAGYPDESAHYVTSLMVRDFIAGGHYTHPMDFATNYYEHYPKVAFGHWPPLFYVVSGLWMLVFSASRQSVQLELAFLMACLAWMMFRELKRWFGWRAGVLGGALLAMLPIMQVYSDEMMAESLLTIVSFGAAIYLASYVEHERWQDSALFGIFASLAILTKGNGWQLGFLPPIVLLLTRRFDLLAKRTFWIPVLVVGGLCGPWQWFTLGMAKRGWQGGDHPTFLYSTHALAAFVPIWLDLLGWGLLPLMAIGVLVKVILPSFRKGVEPYWASMIALAIAAWVFHAIVPAGIESRKMITAVPGAILFLFSGGCWVSERARLKPALVAGVAALVFLVQEFRIPHEVHYGYAEAARFIADTEALKNCRILVSSERDGEGMLVSELAMVEDRPGHTILRGTKVMASTDWNGNVFANYQKNPAEVLRYLKENQVRLVVTDNLAPTISFPHQKLLLETLAKDPEQFRLMGTFHGDLKGEVSVYRVE